MSTRMLLSLAAVLCLSAQARADVVWTDWTQAAPGAADGSAVGTLARPDGAVTVSFSGNVAAPTQVAGGTHYWSPATPYLSAEVPNAPPASDIIAMTGGPATGVNRLTFSQAVVDPVIAVVSMGQGGVPVRYRFDQPFTLLSQGRGYWGGCDTCLSTPGENVLLGREGHGVIRFTGTFTEITWTTPDTEYWHGFTVGVQPVPEPESYALLVAGLGALAVARRRGRR